MTRRRSRARAAPAVPESTRAHAIGDIHGRADLLGRLHEMIREDAARQSAPRKVVIYIGDYVDRGPESRRVIDLVLDEPLAGFEAIHLRGNHEDMMLGFLDDPLEGMGWLVNGGIATLASYGVTLDSSVESTLSLARARDELERRLPGRHREFLASLALSHVEGDYLFVHAGIRPGVALEEQTPYDLMWIRDEFLYSPHNHGKVVVHGHTIGLHPEVRFNRIAIDTGAFATGTLTCLVLEGTDRRFLHTI